VGGNLKTHLEATFAVKGWDELTWEGKPQNEVSGAKQTHAIVTCRYQGGLVGESSLHYLMTYPEAGTVYFVGLEKFAGTMGDRSGSFVLQHNGTYSATGVKTIVSVVPGSGTGGFKGLNGEGLLAMAGELPEYPFVLDYEFD
jgi:hypothetical protein